MWKKTKYEKYSINEKGEVKNELNGKVLKSSISGSSGYWRVTLYVDGKSIPVEIHRLLAETYLEYDPNKKLVVDHIDDNPLNNELSNLRWVTQSENIKKATKRQHTQLTDEQKNIIIDEYKTGRYSLVSITTHFNKLWGFSIGRQRYTRIIRGL